MRPLKTNAMRNNIIYIGLNLVLSVIIENITVLPWWSFLVTTILMSLFCTMKRIKIRSFLSGFISGFLNWFGATIFFHNMYDGQLMDRVSEIFYMPTFLFVIVIGIIGGLLNGLASYTGYAVIAEEDVLQLD